MDALDRIELSKKSRINKKLEKILEHEDKFLEVIQNEVGKLAQQKVFDADKDNSNDGDMIVCVRVRPRLAHEEELKFLETTFTSNPSVTVLEPSIDFKGRPKTVVKKFSVDLAFGPEHDNKEIYSVVGLPLVHLALQGGICSMLSYGQTGSGKTFTMSGLLDFIAEDLFENDGTKNGTILLHVSYFELLGSGLSDLLSPGQHKKLEILEDKFGAVNVVGAEETRVQSPGQLKQLLQTAAGHRKTSVTFKNDTSSRSHAVCKIRVENTVHQSAEDGCLFVIDLAGAENAADSQFHDKDRIKESQHINKSLMTLKECIINRAKSSANPAKHFHIPFRGSKLTLLLKDAFELESHKICRTVVFANVSPTVVDNSMTLNTLRYVAPIKEGMLNREKVVPDPSSPMNWDNQTLRLWVHNSSNGKIDPTVLCPFESGRQMLRIPEIEFIERVMSSSKISSKGAKMFYDKLWKLFIDLRTADRKRKKKDRFVLNPDQTYGIETQVGPEINIYESAIEDDLWHKGVRKILFMNTSRVCLAMSKDLEACKIDLNSQMKVLATDLRTLEEIALGDKKYKRLESDAVSWKGFEVNGEVNIERSIIRVDRIRDVIFCSGAPAEGKIDHRTLEMFIEGTRDSLKRD